MHGFEAHLDTAKNPGIYTGLLVVNSSHVYISRRNIVRHCKHLIERTRKKWGKLREYNKELMVQENVSLVQQLDLTSLAFFA